MAFRVWLEIRLGKNGKGGPTCYEDIAVLALGKRYLVPTRMPFLCSRLGRSTSTSAERLEAHLIQPLRYASDLPCKQR